MNLYVMRHGTTIWNEKRRTQGQVNNKLSISGIEQAKNLAYSFKNISVDLIFTSPLLRAVQTANIINKYHKVKIIKDHRLTDIDQGYFTGKYFDKLSEEEKIGKNNKDKKYNMESFESLYMRIKSFYDYILEAYKNYTILVVAHSGITAMLDYITKNNIFNKETYSEIALLKNAEIKKII